MNLSKFTGRRSKLYRMLAVAMTLGLLASAFAVSAAAETAQQNPVRYETMPFMGRTTACPYLECATSNRRCLSASPAPVSLRRQAKYCMRADHRSCSYYRKARGMAAVPPAQAAFYTAAVVTVLVVLLLAGIR